MRTIHHQDPQELELFKALSECAIKISNTTEEYSSIANILSSEITDVKRYQNIHLKAFLMNCDDDLNENDDDEDDEMSELIDANPRLFKKILRRRSMIETTNKTITEKVFRKNSVTAALEHIIPPTVSSSGWDFTHLLALSTTTRLNLSRGLLRHLLSCLTSFNRTYLPTSVSLLADSPNLSYLTESSHQLIQPLYHYISSTPIHPEATTIVNALCQLYYLNLSQVMDAKDTRYHGRMGLTSLRNSLIELFDTFRILAVDSSQCLSILAKINSVLEEIICKCEGNHRINILSRIYSSILLNSFEMEIPSFPETNNITSAIEYLQLKFPHPMYPTRLLTPTCDTKWIEYILLQEKSVTLIIHQRKISVESEQVAADIARFFLFFLPSFTFSSGQYDLQQRRRISMIEESILPQISALILNIPNHNLRYSSLISSLRGSSFTHSLPSLSIDLIY